MSIREGSVWFVEHPTYRYNEDVKDLAARQRLKVVDARFKDHFDKKYHAKDAPKLTLKDEYKPKKAEK